MPTIEVTEQELKNLQKARARKAKKEQELQKLRDTEWEVKSLEEVIKKTYEEEYYTKNPSTEQLKYFTTQAQKMIDVAKEVFSPNALKQHDKIVEKMCKQGWVASSPSEGLRDGYLFLTMRRDHTIHIRFSPTNEYSLQGRYYYRIDQDRVIVYSGGDAVLLIKGFMKRIYLRKNEWTAEVINTYVGYNLNHYRTSDIEQIMGKQSDAVRQVLSDLCWVVVSTYQINATMTDKQIISLIKKWFISATKNKLTKARQEIKNYEAASKLLSATDFTKLLTLERKEE